MSDLSAVAQGAQAEATSGPLGWFSARVFAPMARLGPGELSGDHVDAQGSATLGVGGNMLVGGTANSIAPQPAQRGGPGWRQHCCRIGKPGTPAGALTFVALHCHCEER